MQNPPKRTPEEEAHLDRLYAIMDQSFETDTTDLAAQHDSVVPTIDPGLQAIYAIMGERFISGSHDTAERHNEHQP